MAPEPCTTLAVEEAVRAHDQWILDGFPRSPIQLRSKDVRREAIVFLDVSPHQALRRLRDRAKINPRADDDTIAKRVREQTALHAPIRQMAAVIIPTSFQTPDRVNQMILEWLAFNIHPNEHGSNAR